MPVSPKTLETNTLLVSQCQNLGERTSTFSTLSVDAYRIMPQRRSVADDERLTSRLDAVTELIVVRQLNDAMLFVGRAVLIQSITQRHEKTP